MELGLGITKIIPPILYLATIWVIILTLLYKIEIGIYFAVPLLPLQNILDSISHYPVGKDLMDILYLAMIVRWAFDSQKKEGTFRKTPWQKKMDLVVICICGWTLLSLLLGVLHLGDWPLFSGSNERFVTWKNYIMLPLLYFIVVNNVKSEKSIRILLILMAFSLLFMGRNFYNNFVGRDHSHYSHELRGSGSFTYLGPNELAVFYAQNTIVMIALFLLQKNKWDKLLFIGASIFNVYATLFLFSRGGYLATVVSFLFLGIARERKLLVAMIFFFIFWRSITPVAVQERIDMTQTEKGIDHSITDRYVMWEQAANLILGNPVFGMGFRSVPFIGIQASHHRNSLHNGYLEVAVEQGVTGLILYLMFYGYCIRFGLRLYRKSESNLMRGLGLGFTGSAFAVLAGNIAGSYWFYINVSGFFWTLAGLVVCAMNIAHREKCGDQYKSNPRNEDLRYRPPLPERAPQMDINDQLPAPATR